MAVLGIDIGGSGIKGAPVNVKTGEFVEGRFRAYQVGHLNKFWKSSGDC